MADLITNIDVFNSIYDHMSPTFQSRIPKADATNFSEIGMLITSSELKIEMNEWLNALVNRIGLTMIYDKQLHNRLGYLVRGNMEFGDLIQEIAVGVVKGEDYERGLEDGSVDPFRITNPEVKALYHRVNSRRKYRTTTYLNDAKRAFTSEGGLMLLLEKIVSQLTKASDVDDWLAMKEIFNTFINEDTPLPKQEKQRLEVKPIIDETTGKDFIKKIKQLVSEMSFVNSGFNQMGMMKMTSANELIFFIRADILNIIGVDVLASAFNRSDLGLTGAGSTGQIKIEPMDDFGGLYPVDVDDNRLYPIYNIHGKATGTYSATVGGTTVVEVDKWVDPNASIIGVICERDFPLITRQHISSEVIYNPENMATNHLLHFWSQYGYSGFADAVIVEEGDG